MKNGVWTIYYPREYEHNGEKKTEYTKVGVALWHRDDAGLTLKIHLPIQLGSGTDLVVFAPKER